MVYAPNIPKERENILCMNVSIYLPKEKEETNFLKEARGNSAIWVKGEANKRGNKSKDFLGKCWPCDSMKEKGNWLMNM